jgi:replicative DNA helicase
MMTPEQIAERPAMILTAVLCLPLDVQPENIDYEIERLKQSHAALPQILSRTIAARDECIISGRTGDFYRFYEELGGNIPALCEYRDFNDGDNNDQASVSFAVNAIIGQYQAGKVSELLPEMKRGKILVNDIPYMVIGSEAQRTADSDVIKLHAAIGDYRTQGPIPTISTGFSCLDETLGGLARGRFTVLAARPAVGKSSFALSVAVNNIQAGRSVLLASAEMDRREIIRRLDRSCGERLDKLPDYLTIMDGAGQTVSRIARMAVQDRYDLVIVDHLGILDPGPALYRQTEYEQVTALSNQIRVAAKGITRKDGKVPAWLVLSQLNRGKETENMRPTLSNLRASGAVEQDAYAVVFAWEPEERRVPDTEREVRLTVAKNRGGPCGEVTFEFRTYPGTWRETR